jgi:hypothetical protein
MNTTEAAAVREGFNARYPGINDLIHQTFMHDAKARGEDGEEIFVRIGEETLLGRAASDPDFPEFLRAHEMSTCRNSSGVKIVFESQNRTLTFIPPRGSGLIPSE